MQALYKYQTIYAQKHFEDKDKMGISHLPRVVGEIVTVERVVELAPVTAVIYKHVPI